METFDRGSAIQVEVEFKQKVPFGVFTYFDPTTPVITITNPLGTAVVTDQVLTKSAVGKYYYILQTGLAWEAGVYSGVSHGVAGSYEDTTVNEDLFRLK